MKHGFILDGASRKRISKVFGPGAKTGFNDENIKSLGLVIYTIFIDYKYI